MCSGMPPRQLADEEGGHSEQMRPDNYVNVPVGQQAVQVSPELASFLRSTNADRPPELVGTRVWINRRREGLDLHLGDVDRSTLDG